MLNKSLERKNVPPRLYEVMTFINGMPQNQITIAEKLQINKNVMVNLIDELEKRGYCVRVQRPDMRRREYNIEITPKGSKVLRDCGKLVRSAERELLAQLTDEERTELCRLMEKSLAADLNRMGIL
jgi:DNA-binding MarR family transcriptional regulator